MISEKLKSILSSNKLPWIIILFGIILRLAQYIHNRSLWIDEAALALNIVNRTYPELLFEPLVPFQVAPFGFLCVSRTSVLIFGNNEYALRLFPLIAGIISLLLFYKVARKMISPWAVPVALGLFSISNPLIYYSSELKQYSSDIAVALLLYYFTMFPLVNRKFSISDALLFGSIGAFGIFFSHSSVFVLAGISIALIISGIIEKEWSKISKLTITFSLWIVSFAFMYFVSLNDLTRNEELTGFWTGYFAPAPLGYWQVKWYFDSFFNIFENPAGLPLSGIASFLFIIGSVSIFQKNRKIFSILMSPLLLALIASGFHLYPFYGRLLLFIVPNIYLFVAEGTEQIRLKLVSSQLIWATLIVLLFYPPIETSAYHLIRPRAVQEIRPIISYMTESVEKQDLIYVYYGSYHAFKYYWTRYGFDTDYIVGVESRNKWNNYLDDLRKLHGNERVWVVFSHVCDWKGVDEEKYFLDYLDNIGKKLHSLNTFGSSVYLYDLSF